MHDNKYEPETLGFLSKVLVLTSLVGGLTLIGWGVSKMTPKDPSEIDYSQEDGIYGNDRFKDIDGDNIADLVVDNKDLTRVKFVAEDMVELAKEKGYMIDHVSTPTPRMTDDLRLHASQILRSQRAYQKSLDMIRFNAYKERQAKRK